MTYGSRIASILCTSWAHRAQYYYDLERSDSSVEAAGGFQQRDHDAYVEPSELIALLASPDATPPVLARLKDIREFML